MIVGCNSILLEPFVTNALIALSTVKTNTCIEISKDRRSIRVMFGSLTALSGSRHPDACAGGGWQCSLNPTSSASSSVVPALAPRRYLHLPSQHRYRRSHYRAPNRIPLRPQILTRSGSPHQRSRRPRRHYRDLRHLHRHWTQGHHPGVQLQESLLTMGYISVVEWTLERAPYVIRHLVLRFDTFSTEKVLQRLLLLTIGRVSYLVNDGTRDLDLPIDVRELMLCHTTFHGKGDIERSACCHSTTNT